MWGYTAVPAKLFFISAHAFFPFIVFFVHWSAVTFWFSVFGILFFVILERFKFTPKVFFRAIAMFFGGPRKRVKRSILYYKLQKGL